MTPEQQRIDIKEAKKGNAFLFGSNREIRRLTEYLHPGEKVHKIVSGSPPRGRGIIVATDERILFIRDGWVFRENQDFPYETLSTVEFKTGVFFGTLTVFGKGDEATYHWVGRFAGAAFTKLVRQLSAANRKGTPLATTGSPKTTPGASNNLSLHDQAVQQLRNLENLRNEGIISIDEYEIKRQEWLNKL